MGLLWPGIVDLGFFTDLYDLPTWFVARNYPLIAFGPLPKVFVVDTANIRTANCRSFYSQQNFSVTWTRKRHAAEFNFIVTR